MGPRCRHRGKTPALPILVRSKPMCHGQLPTADPGLTWRGGSDRHLVPCWFLASTNRPFLLHSSKPRGQITTAGRWRVEKQEAGYTVFTVWKRTFHFWFSLDVLPASILFCLFLLVRLLFSLPYKFRLQEFLPRISNSVRWLASKQGQITVSCI
jgi:hypothetical protein